MAHKQVVDVEACLKLITGRIVFFHLAFATVARVFGLKIGAGLDVFVALSLFSWFLCEQLVAFAFFFVGSPT